MLVADALAIADLRGVRLHGVLRLGEYVDKLTKRGVNPVGHSRVVQDHAAALVIDSGNSMGQIGTSFAMQQTIERARQQRISRWRQCAAVIIVEQCSITPCRHSLRT